MQWFYSSNGQQSGPVSETQLDELALAGTVSPETLVWREGQANWQPHRVARPSVPPNTAMRSSLPPLLDQQFCVECQRAFSTNDLLRFENGYVCAACKPVFFQKLREGLTPGTDLWRSGKFLVLRKDAVLPERCVKCNAPSFGKKLRRKLFWHPPWLYVLIPVGLLVYAIIATIVGKRAQVEISLCQNHRRIRWRDLLITWLLVLSALGGFMAAIWLSSGWPAFLSVALLIAAAVYGSVRTTMVKPKRIDDQVAWLKGVTPAFLAELPEYERRG